ncbi:hypothetical protein EX895_006124 [Sporisorium graminicola]|uniref:Uncharacterized protein n=1 Tax=Sporisorium graminicola TaxID=280036 RepID=A0A4U7KLS0_9BASI|nr:hypothetical protein EX895_006124 [Sporisorium graminicola]TKY85044.1 hypothetical protein EX895_006124 [Sporisorium graminicola]
MPSSYYYVFHAPPPAPETAHSSRSAVASEPDTTLFESLANWSQQVGSTVKSAIPPINSLIEAASAEASKLADSSSRLVQSSLSPSSVTSWFSPPSSETERNSSVPAQASVAPIASKTQQVKEPADANAPRTTTFTFCLFGAASTAAVYLLIRNRRTMNRLQSAKSLAYRDARAWRRVALDFARINALSASRVQNLVAASLRDGNAGADVGRQIERELKEATRAVAQRRNWIQEQDRKDAESTTSASSLRSFGDGWGDVLDPHGTGFFFGSRAGRLGSDLGEYGRWKPKHSSRHDDVSESASDGLAFKSSQPWSRCTPSDSDAGTATTERSAAQLKWQRVTGHTAAEVPIAASSQSGAEDSSAKASASSSEAEIESAAREEWIGDVDRAIRERDLRTSQTTTTTTTGRTDQAAVDAFSRSESEPVLDVGERNALRNEAGRDAAVEDEHHLLPVSDLYIATNGQMRDTLEAPIERVTAVQKTKKAKIGAAQLKTTVTSDDKTVYPISDQFRDLQDIFIAAWDGNFAGLTHPASAAEISSTSKPDDSVQSVKANPNRALFERLRSDKAKKDVAKNDSDATSTTAEEIEFMAELMFPSSVKQDSPAPFELTSLQPEIGASPDTREEELTKKLEQKQSELTDYKRRLNELSERLDSMRDMCHDLTDEATRREKTHRIQVEQLDHKIGLFTVWAEEVQRRLGLETPPFFASLRQPLKRD